MKKTPSNLLTIFYSRAIFHRIQRRTDDCHCAAMMNNITSARPLILSMIHATGILAEIAQRDNKESHQETTLTSIRTILDNTIQISVIARVNLYVACTNKMRLNDQKYPKDVCEEKVSVTTANIIRCHS